VLIVKVWPNKSNGVIINHFKRLGELPNQIGILLRTILICNKEIWKLNFLENKWKLCNKDGIMNDSKNFQIKYFLSIKITAG
jgi:hypothetical protein